MTPWVACSLRMLLMRFRKPDRSLSINFELSPLARETIAAIADGNAAVATTPNIAGLNLRKSAVPPGPSWILVRNPSLLIIASSPASLLGGLINGRTTSTDHSSGLVSLKSGRSMSRGDSVSFLSRNSIGTPFSSVTNTMSMLAAACSGSSRAVMMRVTSELFEKPCVLKRRWIALKRRISRPRGLGSPSIFPAMTRNRNPRIPNRSPDCGDRSSLARARLVLGSWPDISW